MSKIEDSEVKKLVETTHLAADFSAKKILPFFRGIINVDHKEGKGFYDPVTDADRDAEKVIRRVIGEHWPDHGIIGEEFGQTTTSSDYCWIIDPIDGTRAFVMGSPLWGTLIGLNYKDTPLLGMMNQPFTGERFWGSQLGSFGRWSGETRALKVRSVDRLSDAIITSTCPDLFGSDDDRLRFDRLRTQCRMTRFGGDCYNYCLLAMGHIDLVVESGLQTYDIAPLVPLVQGAGGVITSWSGEGAGNGGQIIAAGSKALHEEAMAILNTSV